jgi:hypothetical protein
VAPRRGRAITPVTNSTRPSTPSALPLATRWFNAHPNARARPPRRPALTTGPSWGGRPARPRDRDRRADHRQRPRADEPSRHPGAARDRRPGRRPRSAQDRQAGDHRRPGKPARGRGPDGGRRAGGPGHRPRRLVRQQHHLHRREGRLVVDSVADRLSAR